MNDLKQTILHKIETGEVAMRPHWQFVVTGILVVASVVFVAAVAVYVLSLVGYLMQLSGAGYAAQFGVRGVGPVLTAVPWRVALLALVVLGALHILVKRFAFAYQKPFVYTIVGVTGFVVASSVMVAQTTAHERMHQASTERGTPGLRELYAERADVRQLHFGHLSATETNGTYRLSTVEGREFQVETNSRTRQPASFDLSVPMVVLGTETDGVITARGIRPAPEAAKRLRQHLEERSPENRLNPPRPLPSAVRPMVE